jgi:hypothetical protein
MTIRPLLQQLLDTLPTLPPHPDWRAYVGYDGYVDKIQKVVRAKHPSGNQYFDNIAALADLLHTLSGKSGQIELRTLATKIGGNAPIMAQALGALGVDNWCVGTLSDPIFESMHPACELVSVGPPAETNAMEFDDGKLIFSEVSVFERLTWAYISAAIGQDTLRSQYDQCRLIAFVDWANLPHGNELWAGYLRDVVQTSPTANTIPADRYFFFDLSDPTKHTAKAIGEALSIAAQYRLYGTVVLGMNENEARRIWLALQGHSPADASRLMTTPPLDVIAVFIQQTTAIDIVLIHPTDKALAATITGVQELLGRLVPQPKVLTGGGDNLNAGFCWGLLNGFELSACLLLGMATSGAYIESGISPTVNTLVNYITRWQTEVSFNL